MILFPNAKINIGLDILHKRADGFHELETLMYPIPLTDILTLNFATSGTAKINFTATGLQIDGNPDDNLICQAYKMLDAQYNLPPMDIHLHKSIPFGAGLGGGSSDCAFAITGINELCKLNLSLTEMEAYAAQLGSDCPFFVRNKPALSTGRGEKLEPFDLNLKGFTVAIVIPPIAISTQSAYQRVKPFVPKQKLGDKLSAEIQAWKSTVVNNFEDSVFHQYAEIKQAKEKLYALGAVYASLSGSGSAVFGIFPDKIHLRTHFPKSYFIWIS